MLCFEEDRSLSRWTHSTGSVPRGSDEKSWGKAAYKTYKFRKAQCPASEPIEGDEPSASDSDAEADSVAETTATCVERLCGVFEVCKSSREFEKNIMQLMPNMKEVFEQHFSPSKVATIIDDNSGDPGKVLEAIVTQAGELVASCLSQSYAKSSTSKRRSLEGFRRATQESNELLAINLKSALRGAMDEKWRKSFTKKLRGEPPVVAEWLSRNTSERFHEIIKSDDIQLFSKEVIAYGDLQRLSGECWNAQESGRKKALKDAQQSGGRRGLDETLDETSMKREERLTSIPETILKEQQRMGNKFEKERKGGRMHAITGADRNSKGRKRDYAVPF